MKSAIQALAFDAYGRARAWHFVHHGESQGEINFAGRSLTAVESAATTRASIRS